MTDLIDGVKVKKLKVNPDERGRLWEILRVDDDLFIRFGQVYATTAYPGVVKAWHYHKLQTDNFSVVKGKACVALYDARKGSPTYGQVNEFIMSQADPSLLQIPNQVYHGFKCLGDEEVIILNCPTEVYHREQPDEYRVDPYDNDIPYDWAKEH
ncbi:MAG: dTDP-4-dehydrorhamnose 3,5-epimerase family protein [Thermodesulfobacteriota bacterium]